jgi:hypothetical protein
MKLPSFLNPEESIAGLDISETALRFIFIEQNGENKIQNINIAITIPMPQGIFHEGKLVNPNELKNTLLKLKAQVSSSLRYVIVSIPDPEMYTHIFSLPVSLSQEKITESVKLAATVQFPEALDQYYYDWQETKSFGTSAKRISLSAGKSDTINKYIETLRQAGFFPVAIESASQSITRSIEINPENPNLLKIEEPSYTGLFVIKLGTVQFRRILPKNKVPNDKVSEEVLKICEFYEFEDAPIASVIPQKEAKPKATFSDPSLGDNPGLYLAALGAAIRGKIPRNEDRIPSIFPINTDQAYTYQKAVRYASFLSGLSIGLSILFVVATAGTWIFMTIIQQNIAQQVTSISNTTNIESGTLEKNVEQLNSFLSIEKQIFTTSPNWSTVLDEIKTKSVEGVSITSVLIGQIDTEIKITGNTENRPKLNEFKKNLSESPIFTAINSPLSDLEKKSDIPFQITLKLKNPEEILNKQVK